jgi:hypothetical protein
MDDLEAIRQLKARYFRFLDTKDWDGFRTVFAPDVHVDVSTDGGGTFDGLDAFLEFLVPTLTGVVTVHHGHMPEIELTSSTTASGIWAMEDLLQFQPQSGIAEVHGWGHYHETYEKVDGTWRIKTTRLSRLRLEVTAVEPT